MLAGSGLDDCIGFWQAQPGLAHRQCVAALLPESRAAILMRAHLRAEVVRTTTCHLPELTRGHPIALWAAL